MAVRTEWDNSEKTIMRWTFTGAWTWDEYYQARTATNARIAAENHIVDLIVDLRNSNTVPNGLLTHGKNAVTASPENIGVTALVGANAVLRAFYYMFDSLYRGLLKGKQLDMVMTVTMDDAYKLIHERQASRVESHHK